MATSTPAPIAAETSTSQATSKSIEPSELTGTLTLPDDISAQPGASTIVIGVVLVTSDSDATNTNFEIVHVSEGSTTPIGVQHSNFWEVRGGSDGRLYLRDGESLAAYGFIDGVARLQDGPIAITSPMPCAIVVSPATVSCGDATIQTGATIAHGEQALIDTSYAVPPAARDSVGDRTPYCGSPGATAPMCNTYSLPDGTSVVAVPFHATDSSSPLAGIALVDELAGTASTLLPFGNIIGIVGTDIYVTTNTNDVAVYDLSTLLNR